MSVTENDIVGATRNAKHAVAIVRGVRKLLAMRDERGLLPTNIETISALQELSILVQHLDVDAANAKGAK